MQNKSLGPLEVFPPGSLDYRGDRPISLIASPGELKSRANKFFLDGNYQEAAKAALEELEKSPDSVFMAKLAVDSMRRFQPASVVQARMSKAIFSGGVGRLKSESCRIALSYVSVFFSETAKVSHQPLDPSVSSQMASIADFGKIRLTGKLKEDLVIAAFGTHSLSQEVRVILLAGMKKYSDEPLFYADAAEEFTGGYKEGSETAFKPGWGPDWQFTEKICDEGIAKWPKYPTFYLYKGLALKKKKQYSDAIKMLVKYRDFIKARGGSRLENISVVIDNLRKEL
jgi:hypothetical protein